MAASPAGGACLVRMAKRDHRFGMFAAAALCTDAEARKYRPPGRIAALLSELVHPKEKCMKPNHPHTGASGVPGAGPMPRPPAPLPQRNPHVGAPKPGATGAPKAK